MFSFANSALSPAHGGIDLGSAPSPWNKIYAGGILNRHDQHGTSIIQATTPAAAAVAATTTTTKDGNLNIVNYDANSHIVMRAINGNIVMEAGRYLISKSQNFQSFGANRVDKIESNYQVFAGVHEISCNRYRCRARDDIHLHSQEGKTLISTVSDSPDAVDVQASRGGISLTSGKGIALRAKESLLLASDREISIGNTATKTISIGNATSETVVHNRLHVRGELVLADGVQFEKHVTTVKRFDNIVYMNNNDNDFGFFSKLRGKKKGLVFSAAKDVFYFAADLGELQNGSFLEPSVGMGDQLADVAAHGVQCSTLEVRAGVTAGSVMCKDTLRGDKVVASTSFSCPGDGSVGTLRVKSRLLLQAVDVSGYFDAHVGAAAFGGHRTLSTTLLAGKNFVRLQPLHVFVLKDVVVSPRPELLVSGDFSTLSGRMVSSASRLLLQNVRLDSFTLRLELQSSASACELYGCSGSLIVDVGSSPACTLLLRGCHMDAFKVVGDTETASQASVLIQIQQSRVGHSDYSVVEASRIVRVEAESF